MTADQAHDLRDGDRVVATEPRPRERGNYPLEVGQLGTYRGIAWSTPRAGGVYLRVQWDHLEGTRGTYLDEVELCP